LNEYLEVIANVEATIENPFPLGKGMVLEDHTPLIEEGFMHKAFKFHYHPLS
jgi:hypothetical protein